MLRASLIYVSFSLLLLSFSSAAVASPRTHQVLEYEKDRSLSNCGIALQQAEDSIVKFHNNFSDYLYVFKNDLNDVSIEGKRAIENYNLYNIMIGNIDRAVDRCMYVGGFDALVEKLIIMQESTYEFGRYLEVILFGKPNKRGFSFQTE